MMNINQELPVMAQDVRMKVVGDEHITKIKEALKNKPNKNSDANSFSICDDILLCAQRVVVTMTRKRCIATISQQTSKSGKDEGSGEKLCLLLD